MKCNSLFKCAENSNKKDVEFVFDVYPLIYNEEEYKKQTWQNVMKICFIFN